MVASRLRRAGAKVFPQSRRALPPEEGRGGDRSVLAVAQRRRRRRARGAAREAERFIGEHSCKQVFDRLAGTWTYWGWKGGYFSLGSRRAGLLRRAPLHAGDADGGAEFAAMVQHRPALGLRHRRPEPGPFLRRFQDRQAGAIGHRLRASAAARLLHPVDHRRPRQRGRHHGPVGARGAAVQIRLRHRLEFLDDCAAKAKSCPAAASRPA